jgi:hypothetical protein
LVSAVYLRAWFSLEKNVSFDMGKEELQVAWFLRFNTFTVTPLPVSGNLIAGYDLMAAGANDHQIIWVKKQRFITPGRPEMMYLKLSPIVAAYAAANTEGGFLELHPPEPLPRRRMIQVGVGPLRIHKSRPFFSWFRSMPAAITWSIQEFTTSRSPA